ncbi:MAG: Pilus assembly protein CpaB [Acidimicrobiales bacterium]|nr:Pilus assembly protein CpaB [Acidimicrobiales bacterium]
MKRANVLIIGGLVLLVAGVALAVFLDRDGDDDPARREVAVLVARVDLEDGQAGDDLVAAGKVGIDRVPASEVADGALAAPTALAGGVIDGDVAAGHQVTSSAVRPEALRAAAVTIPRGKQALALTVGFTEGVGGYAAAGDHVNVYVNVPAGAEGAPDAPYTRLLLGNIEVLDVSDEVAPRRAAGAVAGSREPGAERPPGSQLTILVAVDAGQAEQAVFAASQDEIWFTVLGPDQGPSKTSGVTYTEHYPVRP